ncbi:MAG: hypothetical protein J5I81_14990 [Nitrococcus mobilis]|nr:hypothetical protein [Nitrococcus mobilis]
MHAGATRASDRLGGHHHAEGQPLEFNAANLEAALQDVDVLRGLIEALSESARDASRKNSKPPPAP